MSRIQLYSTAGKHRDEPHELALAVGAGLAVDDFQLKADSVLRGFGDVGTFLRLQAGKQQHGDAGFGRSESKQMNE